jgi:hypothetical protein
MVAMPIPKRIERLREDGPYVLGDSILVEGDGPDELVRGVIVENVSTGPRHVRITVEAGPGSAARNCSAT